NSRRRRHIRRVRMAVRKCRNEEQIAQGKYRVQKALDREEREREIYPFQIREIGDRCQKSRQEHSRKHRKSHTAERYVLKQIPDRCEKSEKDRKHADDARTEE